MAQQVEYPAIPSTEPSNYQAVVNSLLGHIHRESPTDKELRRHMRSRSIYDKASAALLFDLLGIQVEKDQPTTLTEFGEMLYETDGDLAWKKTLFMELGRRNEILLKYVFDALAERLYSINEMFRVLTSYVYPGEPLTLVNFKNWMGWVEATGMIKYIGIRWGPSPLVKEVESYLNAIDIEELLEDEGYEEEEGEEEEVAEDAPGAEPATSEEAEAELPELPPEPPLPAGAAPTTPAPAVPAPAKASVGAPAAAAPGPMPTYQVALTLRSIAEIQEVQKVLDLDPAGAEMAQQLASLDDAELAHNLEGVRDLWGTAPDKALLGFEAMGIDPKGYNPRARKKGVKTFFVYRALIAATCAHRPMPAGRGDHGPAPDGRNRFEVLETSGALSRHFQEGQAVDDVVTGLVAAGYGSRLDVLALTPYLVLAKQALDEADSWLKDIEKAESADTVWEAVYSRLHAGVFTIELIWLVREMARHGHWSVEGLEDAAVVPTQEVLDIAFRIGLLPTPYVAGFPSALYASKTLTGFSGKDYGYEAGLLHFGRQMGCAYDCPHRTVCRFYCREKLRR